MKKYCCVFLTLALLVSLCGCSIYAKSGGAIGIAFSEDVAVKAEYYTLTGYHAITNRYSSGYDGIARQVCTEKSKHYNEWFYDGFTPYNWKDEDTLAISLWFSMIGGSWPHVKDYK